MNLVHDNRKDGGKLLKGEKESVLKSWLMANSKPTIEKFTQLEDSEFKAKLKFNSEFYIWNSFGNNFEI